MHLPHEQKPRLAIPAQSWMLIKRSKSADPDRDDISAGDLRSLLSINGNPEAHDPGPHFRGLNPGLHCDSPLNTTKGPTDSTWVLG